MYNAFGQIKAECEKIKTFSVRAYKRRSRFLFPSVSLWFWTDKTWQRHLRNLQLFERFELSDYRLSNKAIARIDCLKLAKLFCQLDWMTQSVVITSVLSTCAIGFVWLLGLSVSFRHHPSCEYTATNSSPILFEIKKSQGHNKRGSLFNVLMLAIIHGWKGYCWKTARVFRFCPKSSCRARKLSLRTAMSPRSKRVSAEIVFAIGDSSSIAVRAS